LAEQSRLVGASRGLDTLEPKALKTAQNSQNSASNMPLAQSIRAQEAPENIAAGVPTLAQIKPVLDKNACLACHGMSAKLVGPSLTHIADRYKTQSDALNLVSGKIKNGGQGVWGAIPMPAQALSLDEAAQIAKWLIGGMPP
jgi:cytochrome c